MQIAEQLRAFVIDNFLFGQDGDGLAPDDSFLEKGIIDSTGVLELVGFLEKTYGITVEDSDLVPANLDSLERLEAFVNRKVQAREPQSAG